MFKFTTISIVLFITTAINIVAAYIGWQRRKTKSGMYFALGMAAITFWTLAGGFDYAAVSIPLKVFFAKLEYAGYNTAFAFLALFVLSYAGYERWLEKTTVKVFFFTVPVSNILLAWTNDWHGWLWSGFVRSEFGDNTVIFKHGPGYLWAAITGYLMIFMIIVPLWQASHRGSEFSRKQARLLFWSSLFPVISNLFYVFQPAEFKGVDWTSITFSVSSLLFLWALYGLRFLDLVPIARDKLVAELSDGMIVLDMQNRIIDINSSAVGMLESAPEKLIGRDLGEIIPLAQPLSRRAPEEELRTELEFGSADKRYFDVLVSPLHENRKVVVGRLIIFRNITARKQNELRLLQLTQAVTQSPASIVITGLKGNIEYVNPQFTLLTGYTYDEIIGKNPNILKSGHTPDRVYQEMWQAITTGKTWQGEFLNKKKNGELYWEHVVMAPVLDRDGNTLNFIAVKEDITERKQAEAAMEQRFLEIQELHRNLQATQAQLVEQQRTLAVLDERQRLGRDMHDSVNQSIHSLMLFADTLTVLLQRNQVDKAVQVAERIQESGRQALKEIRLLVYEAQAYLADKAADLVNALEERLNMVEHRVGIKAEIIYDDGFIEHCPSAWNENLYWIIMEALNNSLKHAQARNVKIIIHCTERWLNVEVKDDGAGFNPAQAGGGFGMRSMRERTEILGGELRVESYPGNGTSVNFMAEIGV